MIKRIWNEFQLHTVFMKLVVYFISPRQMLGDIKHTTRFINTMYMYRMKWNEMRSYMYALGNESTLVACKSLRSTSQYLHVTSVLSAWSASQRFTRNQGPSISKCKQKKCTSILIFTRKWQITPKSRKINVNFFVTWPVSFIGKYLPRFSYASSQANDIGV